MKSDLNYAIGTSARSQFLPEQSDVASMQFAFAYTITMTNIGLITAQLISRRWLILDSENTVQEVSGLGVVGQQPTLAPGERFEYTSGCVLATPVGTMQGSYYWKAADGFDFEAAIEPFLLSMPRTLH
jgi:ApaG protein